MQWEHVFYTERPPVLSGLWDRRQLLRAARGLLRESRYDLVHCRSYIPAQVGLMLKTRARPAPKLVFDMRGFWADEKAEVGAWPQNRLPFRAIYHYFKGVEERLVRGSDAIVSLTEAGRAEIESWPAYRGAPAPPPITVIPCCVDTNHFPMATQADKRAAKAALGLPPDAPVLGYLGAIGGWYMVDEMLAFFAGLKRRRPEARMLFVTRSHPDTVVPKLAAHGLAPDDILMRSAQRHEVPGLLAAMDLGLSFIKPTYAKTASSPTKQAEYLACGVPIVTNDRIGDNRTLIGPAPGCAVLEDLQPDTLERAAAETEFGEGDEVALDARAQALRAHAVEHFDLKVGGARYGAIYDAV